MVQFGIQNDSGIKKKFMGVDFVEIWSKSKFHFGYLAKPNNLSSVVIVYFLQIQSFFHHFDFLS